MKKRTFLSFVLVAILGFGVMPAYAASPIETTAKSYVLMEASTGEVLMEKDKDMVLPPASITKVMTLLLIHDAIAAGKINWDDTVTISEHAANMGGSQLWLEPGEEQNVRDLVKCIAIASANDAAVAMAEYIGGTETKFVEMMNQKAKDLGMKKTVFKNACGLHTEGHVSTAYDIALMSRALMTTYPELSKTLTIWMDSITHKTRRGESEFGLTNTNKMLKWYDGITGLKTGYTPQAKHCVSATATRDHMNLIAVVMASENSKIRFREAASLLDYGFANYGVKEGPKVGEVLGKAPVSKGDKKWVEMTVEKPMTFVLPKESQDVKLTYDITYDENLKAPLYKGQKIGHITYSLQDKKVGEAPLIAAFDVGKAKFKDMVPYVIKRYFNLNPS